MLFIVVGVDRLLHYLRGDIFRVALLRNRVIGFLELSLRLEKKARSTNQLYQDLYSISISTILESESNVNSQFNYLVDNFPTTHLRDERPARDPCPGTHDPLQLDLDLYTNGVWEFHPNTILYITTKITQMTTIFRGINTLSQSILPSLSSRIPGSSCCRSCFTRKLLVCQPPGQLFSPEISHYFVPKFSVNARRDPGVKHSPETFSQKT